MDGHTSKDFGMKRSASELALQELLTKVFSSSSSCALSKQESIHDTNPLDSSFDLVDRDFTCELRDNLFFSEPRPLLDAQSSICENLSADSPVSANKPEARGRARRAVSGSSHDHSDEEEEEDAETEPGQSEMTNDHNDLKRMRRMYSNRLSARRSRRRKQEYLADLESQVDSLKGENTTLYKQLIEATQQFRTAGTNNRVLKSDVETLRVNVKLAEDLVARGTFTSNLNQLLQTHLSPLPHSINNLHHTGNTSPAITVHRDQSLFPAMSLSGRNSSPGLGNVSSEAVSCVSDIWP